MSRENERALRDDPGQANIEARNLVVFTRLVDREPADRLRYIDSDTRTAMAITARRLNDNAMKYRVSGYDWDLDDIEWGTAGAGLIVGTLRISRG